MASMEGLDYWRLCDQVSVIQAVLLILGVDPADHEWTVENTPSKRPAGYEAIRTALTNAVRSDRIPCAAAWKDDMNGWQVEHNWHDTRIDVADLRKWLKSRGITSGFFFSEVSNQPDYLDPWNEKYAPKLAAAIDAWTAVAKDADLSKGKSVKQALLSWLRRHADKYGLTKDDGNPNEQGIEEVAKVANWDTSGGAPKTPGS